MHPSGAFLHLHIKAKIMKSNYSKLLFHLCIAASLCLSSYSKGQVSTNLYEAQLKKGVDRGFPGFIIAIQKDNENQWVGAKGLSNIEKQIHMKPDDRFHVASITKLFTATAILKLIDKGNLTLSSKAIDYLDSTIVGSIPYINEIKINQLLDHSSGIYSFNNDMDYVQTLIGNKAHENVNWTNEKLLSLAYRERVEPSGEPGSGHYYGDTNYILLGLIVEKASGISLRQFVKQNILDPLHMDNTGYYGEISNDEKIEMSPSVEGYLLRSEDLDRFITLNPVFKEVSNGLINTTTAVEKIDAAAGMVSTAEDLLKFGKALYLGELISIQSRDWLLSIGNDINNENIGAKRQGVITVRNKEYGVLYTSLGDGPGGINTVLAYHPKTNVIVVAFANIFGGFDEHDFFMDEIIPPILLESKQEDMGSNETMLKKK